jgi:hypothetical protein
MQLPPDAPSTGTPASACAVHAAGRKGGRPNPDVNWAIATLSLSAICLTRRNIEELTAGRVGKTIAWFDQSLGRDTSRARTRGAQCPDLDLTPSMHWPTPMLVANIEADRGPVLVTVEYQIGRDDRDRFLEALEKLEGGRRRDEAVRVLDRQIRGAPGKIAEGNKRQRTAFFAPLKRRRRSLLLSRRL